MRHHVLHGNTLSGLSAGGRGFPGQLHTPAIVALQNLYLPFMTTHIVRLFIFVSNTNLIDTGSCKIIL